MQNYSMSKAGAMASKAPESITPTLMRRYHLAIQSRHYSLRTEKAYSRWVVRFLKYHNFRHPESLGDKEINRYLSHLATDQRVSASTQNQALSAILSLYRHVIKREVGILDNLIRAKKPVRIPVVMNRDEVSLVLGCLAGRNRLVCELMYGCGLRLMEVLQLRVQDLDFARHEIRVRSGKGNKDRVVMLPGVLRAGLEEHLVVVRLQHGQDLRDAYGSVELPRALDRK